MDLLKKIVNFSLLFLSAGLFSASTNDSPPSQSINPEIFFDQIVRQYVKEINKEFGYQCLGTGGGMPYDVESFSVNFIANRKATIEEARNLEISLVEKFLKKVNSHEKIRPFLREYPFPVERIYISISFLDKKNKPQFKSSISEVCTAKSIIYYEVEDPKTQRDIEIAKEPYEEALKIVQFQKNQ